MAKTARSSDSQAANAAALERSSQKAELRALAEAAEPDKAAVLRVLKKILKAKELPKTPTATRMQERMKRMLSPALQKAFKVEEKLTRSTLLDEIAMDLLMAFTSPYFKQLLIQKGAIRADTPDAEAEKKVRSWIGRQWKKAGFMEFVQKLPGVGVANGALAGAKSLEPIELFLIRELLSTLLTFEANLYTRITGVVINEAGRPRLPPDLANAASFDEIGDKYCKVAEDLLQESVALNKALRECNGKRVSPEQEARLRHRKSVLVEKLQAFTDTQKQHAISRRIYDRLDKPTASVLGAIVNIVIPMTVGLSGQSGLGLKLLPGLLALQAVANTMDFTRMQRNTLRFIGEHHDFSSLIKTESRGKHWDELEIDDLEDEAVNKFNPVTFQPIEIKKLMDEVCGAAWNNLDARKRNLIEKHARPYLTALYAAKQEKEQQRDALQKPEAPASHEKAEVEDVDDRETLAGLDHDIRELQASIQLCEQEQWMTLYTSTLKVELAGFATSVNAGTQAASGTVLDEQDAPNPLARAIRRDPRFQRLEEGMKNLETAIALHAEGTARAYRDLLIKKETASTPVAKAWKSTKRLVFETERARRQHKIGEIPAMFLKTLGSRYHPAGQGIETALMAICSHIGGSDYMLDGLDSLRGTGPANGEAEAMFVSTLAHIILVSATAVYGRKDFNYTQDYILRLKMGVPDLFQKGGAFLKNVETLLQDGPSAAITDSNFLNDAKKLLQDAQIKGVLSKKQKEVLDKAFLHLYRNNPPLHNEVDPAAVPSEQEQHELMETLRDFARYWGTGADNEWGDKKIRSENGNTVRIAPKASSRRYGEEVSLKKRIARVPQGFPTAFFSIPLQHARMSNAAKAQKLAQKEADKATALIGLADKVLSPLELPHIPALSKQKMFSDEDHGNLALDSFYKKVVHAGSGSR